MHGHAEVLIENGKTVMKHVYIDCGSQLEVINKNGSADITRNCYVEYGSRKKVPIKNYKC